jgi:hypothetical protein
MHHVNYSLTIVLVGSRITLKNPNRDLGRHAVWLPAPPVLRRVRLVPDAGITC